MPSEYKTAQEFIEKALAIRKEIGDRAGEATDYANLGTVFHSLGECAKAKEFIEKALAIRKEIGDREGEARDYASLGRLFHTLGEYDKADEYFLKALPICKGIGDNMNEFQIFCDLIVLKLALFNHKEAFRYLYQCIEKYEKLRDFIKRNDCFKISFLEKHGVFPYEMLSKMLSDTGDSKYAL